ncbi:restriction endonuclease subunit S [Fusobacterium polymorphum]
MKDKKIIWKSKSLNCLGTFSRGVSKHRPRNDLKLFLNGDIPFIQTADVKKSILYIESNSQSYNLLGLKQSKLWDTGTLCITIAANIAETGILKYPMCFPDSIVGFSSNVKESIEIFVYYIFEYIKQNIQKISSGSIQNNINIEFLSTLKFKVPPVEYQKLIAKILSLFDIKINLNNKINDNLEQQAKLLYDYWFTQFDFPDENGKPYRTSGGKMVWNEQLKRDIPEGWEVKSLTEILQKNTDVFDYQSIQPAVDLSIMPSNSIAISQLNSSNSFTTNLFTMKKGDILFGSIRPYLHKAGFAPCDGVVAGTVHSFRVKNSQDNNFALMTVSRDKFFNYAVNVSSGTKMPVVSSDSILDYKVPYNNKIARKYNKIPLIAIISSHIQENQKLISLRDWLLPMLMNGQATIED